MAIGRWTITRRGRFLCIGALLLAFAALGRSAPAGHQALAAGPAVHILPSYGYEHGSHTDVSGTGFAPNETVSIRFGQACVDCAYTSIMGTAVTDASGSFILKQAPTPDVGGRGNYTIGVLGSTGDFATHEFFWATLGNLTISPNHGALGSRALVTVSQMDPGLQISVKWNCAASDCGSKIVLGNATPDNSDGFTMPVTIPQFSAGSYYVGGFGVELGNNQVFIHDTFTIVPATLSPSPTSSPGGSTASVSGTGFQANESVTLKWNCSRIDCTSHYTLLPTGERSFQGVRVLGTATTDSSGNFTKSFTVPIFTPGSYPVGAIGDTSNTFATTPFTVAQPATVTLSPNAGHAGSGYSASGTGFRSGETVTVKFNCASQGCSSLQTLGTATAQPDGSFSIASVTIPNFSARSYPVAAIGGTSNTLATTTFTVN